MPTIFDIEASTLIKRTSEELKKQLKMPDWARFVKTGEGKARPPETQDWFYLRAASMLRKIYMYGPVGVNKLRVKYGNKKIRGHKPEEFRKASGKIIRNILQQLEKSGLIQQAQKGPHKGRAITKKGRSFLDKLSKK